MGATRVAFFGGSFNPPHVAHQLACLYVLETQDVDEVLVVPCYRHPFDKQLAPFEDRLAMCRLATAALGPRVSVSEIEQEIGAPISLTYDTVQALRARRPDAELRLVVGADILAERGKWYRWDDLLRVAPPIVVGRQGTPAPGELGPLVELPAVSSTEVRARVARGEPIATLVPRTVAAYIQQRRLYRGP